MAGPSSSPLIALNGAVPTGLTNWQYSINGLTIGKGTSYYVVKPEGLGSPEVRSTSASKVFDDGDWDGRDTYAGRTLTLSIIIRGADATTVNVLYRTFLQAWYSNPATPYTSLWWQEPGLGAQRLVGRPRRVQADKTNLLTGVIRLVAEFYSPYAPIFGASQTATLTPSLTTGGRTYPLLYPRYYAVTSLSGNVLVANEGSYPAWPVLTVTATSAVTTAQIHNDGTGEWIGFDSTMAINDVLVIDMRLRTATLNGASVRHLMSVGASWWLIAANTTSTLRLTATPATATLSCTVQYAAADIG